MDLSLIRVRLPPFLTDPDPEIYHSTNYVVLDFETTSHNKGLAVFPENRLVLACWSNGPGHESPGLHHKWGTEYGMGELVRHVESADFIVAHNAKFELQWLSRCGLDLKRVLCYDTMLGEYVRGGNRWQRIGVSLESTARRVFGEGKDDTISRMIKSGIDPSDIPQTWLLRYCWRDVDLCERLFRWQLKNLNSKLLAVVYTRCLVSPVLADIEFNGMTLDPETIRARYEEVRASYIELENRMGLLADGVNMRSPKQLRELLYEKLGFKPPKDYRNQLIITPSGEYKTDIDTLKMLKPKTKAQREFLEVYHGLNDAGQELSKYLEKFRECLEEDDGRLLAQFNQTATQTHRLSSSGLAYRTQFQNLPRTYKPFFKARREGWVVGEADGAQLEFRGGAHLGRDAQALLDIEGGVDIHAFTAATLTANSQLTDRQGAKEHTFKPLYGGTSGTDAEQAYYQAFREKYKGIADAQTGWINTVLKDKELETEWGLKFYWPDTEMRRSGYITNTPSICNYPVQSFCTAEIIPIALVYFWHYIKALDAAMFLVNTVHDSIIAELPPEEDELFHELSKQCLISEVYFYLDKVYGISLSVPLGAGVMIGQRWADKEAKAGEVVYNAPKEMYSGDTKCSKAS